MALGKDSVLAPVTELVPLLRTGALSPVELTEMVLAGIESLDSKLHAFISVTATEARIAARKAETALKAGDEQTLLLGVPYACKDLFWTRGVPTTAGSRVLENWVPEENAAAVDRLNRAGAILVGKNNLHEFAYGATGENKILAATPNPWDLQRIAGGSSSGSAAAVACGLAPFALGTDTGGSVRVPATYNGIVGLKPTYGLVSCYGVIPWSWTLDHVGTLTRTVADAAIVLRCLAGYDSRDPASASVNVPNYSEALTGEIDGLRIGVPSRFFFEHVDPEILAATSRVLRCCKSLGAEIIEVETPDMEFARTVSLVVQMPEALSYHGPYLRSKRHLYGDDLRSGFAVAQFIMAEHYIHAKRMLTLYRRQFAALFEHIDLLLTPGCPMIAPQIGVSEVTIDGRTEPVGNAHARFTNIFNMTGQPAMTMPSGWHSAGLPMGVQLIARPFEEATLLRAGDALERALGLESRQPKIF